MPVAFYAPMKPPDHPVPSGDRRVGGLLTEALGRAGHRVVIASRLRSWQAEPDGAQRARLAAEGRAEADRLIAGWRAGPTNARPTLWLTYHLYYKAPDWVGPRVAEALEIPYLVAEASVAPKRALGPWAAHHEAVLAALDRCKLVITLNPEDEACLPDPGRSRRLAPFLDPGPYGLSPAVRSAGRRDLANRCGLDPAVPWLLTVAMMRPGDKLASYRILAETLQRLPPADWRMVVVGDGPARAEVEDLLQQAAGGRAVFLGALSSEKAAPEKAAPVSLTSLYGLADIFVWPAVKEAYGMALLEAQAAGLPAVAGASPGVAAICAHGQTGLLAPSDAPDRLAAALSSLLTDSDLRQAMATAARRKVLAQHSLKGAAAGLDGILREALGGPARATA